MRRFAFVALVGLRAKLNADRVDAVALSGRRRTVFKQVAQVSTAFAANDFGAQHAVRSIFDKLYTLWLNDIEEAGPAAMAIELLIRSEEGLTASSALVASIFSVSPIGACAWIFGPLLTQNVILLRGQLFAPLLIGLLNLIIGHLAGCLRG